MEGQEANLPTVSECQLERCLLHSRSDWTDACNLTEAAAAGDVGVRIGEVGMIERVESLPSKLQVGVLRKSKVFDEADVGAVDPRPLKGVPWRVAKGAWKIRGKGGCIEVLVEGVLSASLVQTKGRSWSVARRKVCAVSALV